MDEKIKARYIDPMVDWSFKRLFGSEVNKDILIEFLKVIFPEHEIEDITYIPAEQLGIMEDDRKAVFDVICRTKNGEEFIVEMQCATQKHFFERALYYTSFPIMKQGKKAQRDEETGIKKEWDYKLNGGYFLGVLDFRYEDDDLIVRDRLPRPRPDRPLGGGVRLLALAHVELRPRRRQGRLLHARRVMAEGGALRPRQRPARRQNRPEPLLQVD